MTRASARSGAGGRSYRVHLGVWLLAAMSILPSATGAAADGGATVHATVQVNPLTVTLAVSDRSVHVGERVRITAVAENLGDTPLRDIQVRLRMSEEPCLHANGSNTHRRGVLHGGGDFFALWVVQAVAGGEGCENVVVLASATAVDPETGEIFTAESAAKVITIGPAPHGPSGAW